jgi:hypothetical protein
MQLPPTLRTTAQTLRKVNWWLRIRRELIRVHTDEVLLRTVLEATEVAASE